MARPLKQNADYFSHDSDMRNDLKIKALRSRFGLEGYAVWSMLLECLTDAQGFELEWSDLTQELIAGDFGIDSVRLCEIVEYMVRLTLIQIENGVIKSTKHVTRMQPLIEMRERQRAWKEGKKGQNGVNDVENANDVVVFDVENAQSKVKESKVKITKVIKEKEKNARGAEDFENENEKTLPPVEDNERESPPVAPPPPPPTIGDIVYEWAKSNKKEVGRMADKAGFLDYAAIPEAVRDFCSFYFEKEAYRANPIGFFREKFEAWLRIRLTKKPKPIQRKNGRDGPRPENRQRQSSEPETYTSEIVLKVFRARYGTLVESLSTYQINRLASAKSETELSSWMEGIYSSLKNGSNDRRSGPVQLGTLVPGAG